jgi:hypothetical protein
VPDTPSDGYGPPAGAGYSGEPRRPANPPPSYPAGPVFGRPPAGSPAAGSAPPRELEPPPPTLWRWWRDRRRKRGPTWRGRLVKLGILLIAAWLVLRACADKPNLLDVRPAPTGPVTSIPGGPTISSSATDPSDVPAEDLTSRARRAAQDASTYTLRGEVDLSATGPITVDLTLTSDGADGEITKDGSTLEVRRRGLTVSSRAPGAASWTEGDLAKLPNGDSIGLRPLLDGGHWITELIPTPESATASPKQEQQGGRTVIRIKLRGGRYLYVNATGTPYPVKLTQPDAQYPNLTFSGWR